MDTNGKIGARKEDRTQKGNRFLCSRVAFAGMRKFPLFAGHLEIKFALSLGDNVVELPWALAQVEAYPRSGTTYSTPLNIQSLQSRVRIAIYTLQLSSVEF